MTFIKITMAMTADGKTADIRGQWRPLCKYELDRFRESLEWADAIIVGATTVKHSNLSFSPNKKNVVRIVLDASLSLTPSYKIFETTKHSTAIFTSVSNRQKKVIQEFNRRGVKIFFLNITELFSAKKIVEIVKQEYGVENILVVGGGKINYYFFKDELLDEYQVTITPYILGHSPYTPVGQESFLFPGKRLRIKTIKVCECGQEVVLTYTKARRG